MKTKKNTSNLRKLGLAVLATVALTNVNLKAEDRESVNALVNLEVFVKAQEEALRYNAPVVNIETEAAIESLENFESFSEASLKYVADSYSASDEVAPELESLEMFANAAESELKYKAPEADESLEAVPAMEKLETLADVTLTALKYKAPANSENEIYDVPADDSNQMLAVTK